MAMASRQNDKMWKRELTVYASVNDDDADDDENSNGTFSCASKTGLSILLLIPFVTLEFKILFP